MSRSKRKPYVAWTGGSNNKDKKIANKKFRRRSKQALLKGRDLPKRLKEVYDIYNFASDGKPHYYKKGSSKYLDDDTKLYRKITSK